MYNLLVNSFTGMFNGLSALGSTESLDKIPELNGGVTPCLSKTSKKRKVLEGSGFSAKKKYI